MDTMDKNMMDGYNDVMIQWIQCDELIQWIQYKGWKQWIQCDQQP